MINSNISINLPRLSPLQLGLGELKGDGSFCCVYNIDKIDEEIRRSNSNTDKSVELNSRSTTSLIDRNPLRRLSMDLRRWSSMDFNLNDITRVRIAHSTSTPCIKTDREMVAKLPKIHENQKTYGERLKSICNEAKILSSINHENIIEIHGLADSIVNNPIQEEEGKTFVPRNFILLDALHVTLDDKIKQWAKDSDNNMKRINSVDKLLKLSKRILNPDMYMDYSLLNCINTLYDVASALLFLHDKNILHRDVKPENIGFDSQGKTKLFDFNLATEVNPENCLEDGTYNLEGGIGTCRYMSPEVATYKPYNQFTDVYSFGLTMYAVLSLIIPFEKLSIKKWIKRVIMVGQRPSLNDVECSEDVKALIQACWDAKWTERPTFHNIVFVLNIECARCRE